MFILTIFTIVKNIVDIVRFAIVRSKDSGNSSYDGKSIINDDSEMKVIGNDDTNNSIRINIEKERETEWEKEKERESERKEKEERERERKVEK